MKTLIFAILFANLQVTCEVYSEPRVTETTLSFVQRVEMDRVGIVSTNSVQVFLVEY